MNSREFEKYLKDEGLQDTTDGTLYAMWNYQQKKINDLQLRLDIKDDIIMAYKLVIDALIKTALGKDKALKKQNESIATLIDVITEAADV